MTRAAWTRTSPGQAGAAGRGTIIQSGHPAAGTWCRWPGAIPHGRHPTRDSWRTALCVPPNMPRPARSPAGTELPCPLVGPPARRLPCRPGGKPALTVGPPARCYHVLLAAGPEHPLLSAGPEVSHTLYPGPLVVGVPLSVLGGGAWGNAARFGGPVGESPVLGWAWLLGGPSGPGGPVCGPPCLLPWWAAALLLGAGPGGEWVCCVVAGPGVQHGLLGAVGMVTSGPGGEWGSVGDSNTRALVCSAVLAGTFRVAARRSVSRPSTIWPGGALCLVVFVQHGPSIWALSVVWVLGGDLVGNRPRCWVGWAVWLGCPTLARWGTRPSLWLVGPAGESPVLGPGLLGAGPGGEWVAVCVLQSGCGLCPTLARRGTRLFGCWWRPWCGGPAGVGVGLQHGLAVGARRGMVQHQQWMVDCFQPGCSGWGRARPVRSATKSRTAETVETGLPHLAQVRTVLGGMAPAARQYDCVWPHGPPPSTRM